MRLIKAAVLAAIFGLMACVAAFAQVGFVGIPLVPAGFCQWAPTSASFLSANCAAGKYAYICASAIAYYRDDGVAAVGTVGIPIQANTCIWYTAGPFSQLSIISASGTISAAIYK
jgi:hypothetical protein